MNAIYKHCLCGAVLLVCLVFPSFGASRAENFDSQTKMVQKHAVAGGDASHQLAAPECKKDQGAPLVPELILNAKAFKLHAKWVIGAPLLIVGIVLVMLLRPRRKNDPIFLQTDDAPATPSLPADAVPKPVPRPKPKPTRKLSDQVQVLRFFLQLFKNQHNADPEAPAQIVRVETRTACPSETYEMRIMPHEEWIARRMSIGLLGQGGGSRSRCFYVIYDTHMVIKIPAEPMTRFSDYKRQIAAEGRIVERLAPRLCIVPKVSVILKAVHSFDGGEQLPEEVLEARYTRLLESNPEFQEYLKMEGSFAFFMDLTKHFFLSTVLEEIHSGYDRLSEEARQHPELIWDHNSFVSRYGEDASFLGHALQKAYNGCEGHLLRVVEEAGVRVSVYHLRQWFLAHMIGETIRHEEYDLPLEVITKANQLLGEVAKTNQRLVIGYCWLLKDYIRKTRFSQYRRPFENLASTILDLLAWIGHKKLALRDLKPENLFVAGNPDEYPAFLTDPRKFSIGLIDVETAVPIDAEDPVLIPQPQLAGTPLYATPTHLMSNAILMETYDDLASILHLQDWFATIAMLYKTVSGENLFGTTAHVFPEMINYLKVLDPAGPDMRSEVIRIHRLFWNSAVAEFQQGMARHCTTFSLVEVTIPEDLRAEMVSYLHDETRELEKIIAKAVVDQTFFDSDDKRRFLKEASADRISQMKNKLVQESENGQNQQSQVLLYFEILEKTKKRLEVKYFAIASLTSPSAGLTLDQLLEIMFQKVLETMYPSYWPELTPKLYGSSSYLTTNVETYQATM